MSSRILDPQEDDIACDPAAGSGGFLIRFFEVVREKIAARLDAEYRAFAAVFNNPSLNWVRAFVEDRARILAVVSLPSETFTSSGASVKCSLLFLKKFTVAEKRTFDATATAARADVTARLAPAHETAAAPVREKIAAAKASSDVAARKPLERQLADLDRTHAEKIAAESRTLLKRRATYPIFFYEAAKVGITATGEPDDNELYLNDRLPPGVTKTALELYREFEQDPHAFFADAPAA